MKRSGPHAWSVSLADSSSALRGSHPPFQRRWNKCSSLKCGGRKAEASFGAISFFGCWKLPPEPLSILWAEATSTVAGNVQKMECSLRHFPRFTPSLKGRPVAERLSVCSFFSPLLGGLRRVLLIFPLCCGRVLQRDDRSFRCKGALLFPLKEQGGARSRSHCL